MILILQSCCGIDAPAHGTRHSRCLWATFISQYFIFPKKGRTQAHAWLIKPKGAETQSFPFSRGDNHSWGVDSQLEGFSPWFATIPPSPHPETGARLSPSSFPLGKAGGLGIAVKVLVSLAPQSTSRAWITDLTSFCCALK